jgi:hypothetical protein
METLLAPITEILFFVSEDSRGFCNVFLQTTDTGRSAIASEVFSFPDGRRYQEISRKWQNPE